MTPVPENIGKGTKTSALREWWTAYGVVAVLIGLILGATAIGFAPLCLREHLRQLGPVRDHSLIDSHIRHQEKQVILDRYGNHAPICRLMSFEPTRFSSLMREIQGLEALIAAGEEHSQFQSGIAGTSVHGNRCRVMTPHRFAAMVAEDVCAAPVIVHSQTDVWLLSSRTFVRNQYTTGTCFRPVLVRS